MTLWEEERHTDLVEESYVKSEAEIGVMLPQAKECLELSEARTNKKGSPLEASEGAWPCQHFGFELVASRTVKEWISVVLNHSVRGNLLW